MKKLGFDEWLKAVENRIAMHCYAAVELEDARYREYYDRGLSVEDAAQKAMDFAYYGTHPPGIVDNF